MTALLAIVALALLFVAFGMLAPRERRAGPCHGCPADEEAPELCGACPLRDSAGSEEEVKVEP